MSIKLTRQTKNMFFLIILVIPMCMIFANNTGTVDHMIYANWYKATAKKGITDRFEIGYTLCMLFGNRLGLSMSGFLMIYSAVGLLLIAKSFYDYCRYPVLGMVMYAAYPFLMDAEQLRNFMSMAIVIYGLRYLKEFSVKNVIKFVGVVLLASTFHISSLVCLIYMLGYLRNLKKILKISIVLSIIMIWGYFIASPIFKSVLIKLGREVYVSNDSFLFKVFGWGSFAVLVNVIIYIYYYKTGNKKKKQQDNNWIKYIIPCAILMCSFIIVSSQAYRFFRNMVPLIYIVLLNIGIEKEGVRLKINVIKSLVTIVAISICIFFWHHQLAPGGTHYEYIVKPIFEDTLLSQIFN